MPKNKAQKADAASKAMQTALTVIANRVHERPLDHEVEMPDDLDELERMLRALIEISASLVNSFDKPADDVIELLRMNALIAVTSTS